ncbi:cytochrome C [Coraliomargarita sinensis]|uniref:Cytochrome C n=1 Tax=Coraliomargarita sinensis TaxID=2174842 RepID=A0A317ZH87_9BACT|nr:cytochrome c [Coraliomargarita sinensis]PXA05034.1 cytochrome C [Coraliomargarita sinensis]
MSEDNKEPTPANQGKESLEKAAMQDEQMQDIHAQLIREKEEPSEGFSPIPVFLVFVIMVLGFWGGIYLVTYSGEFSAKAFDPDYKVASTAPVVREIPLPEIGAKVYRNQCAQCHQADGNGLAGVYPPLGGSSWVTGHPEVMARILINGLNGPIEVAGNTYNGNMPAFGPSGLNLKPKEIAGVITYVRQEWGNEASEMSVEMIESYLEAYASRSTPWQAAELREDLGPVPEPAPEAEPEEDTEGEAEAAAETEVAQAG